MNGAPPGTPTGIAPLGPPPSPSNAVTTANALREGSLREVRKAVVGQDEPLELMLCALIAGGHVLLEGVPGVAKTLMAKALAQSIGAEFKRIQFTPDLMPADILGTSVFDLKSQSFVLVRGPIFTDLLLTDEINRAPAKTQSALLEAMQERSVSLEGKHITLSPLFTVFATQNPVESEGTYPLPEAQLDRFLFKVEVSYPSEEDEDAILSSVHHGFDSGDLHRAGVSPAISKEQVLQARGALREVTVEPPVLSYIRKLVAATRNSPRIRLGAGPRAAVHLLLAAKALAALRNRPFVTPDDVRYLAGPVLKHRLLLSPDAELDGATPADVLREVVNAVEVPPVIPSARLWLALCLLAIPTMAAGFVPGIWPLVLLLDFILLGLGLVDFLTARQVQLKAWRTLPTKLSVGVANKVELHLINHSARAVQLKLKDDVPEEFAVDLLQLEPAIAPSSRARSTYRATPIKRGKFSFGDINLRVRGPLGLVWQERVIPASESVAVFPDLRGASRLLLSDAALDMVNLGLRQLRRDGKGSEFARLRDYAQGDSVREVDWKATARRGKPVTRVMESERSQSILICVDAGRSMAARVDGLTKLDHAVNAALFLAFVAVRNGDRVGLVVFADGVKAYLAPNSGRAQYRKIVDILYSAKPHLTYVDYLALFKELNLRLMRRSLLCVFTDFLDEEQASTLVLPLRRLAKRHVPLCLSVKDTALGDLLLTPPPGPEEAFQQAVACELLFEREHMKSRIGQQGVQMLDVHPEELSLAAVNRYLEIKARGSL